MKFVNQLLYKNCRSKLSTTLILFITMIIVYFSMISCLFVNMGLINSLNVMERRLGADIMVVPYQACTKQEFNDIVLQGRSSEFYMSKDLQDNIAQREGIKEICTQFYFGELRLEGYDEKVDMIGIEKDKDFLLDSWLKNHRISQLSTNEAVVGYNLKDLVGKKIDIHGNELMIVDSIQKIDEYMDSTIYTDMSTIEQMISSMNDKENNYLKRMLPSRGSSTVLINVNEDYLVEEVLDDINIKVRGVKAYKSNSTVISTAQKLKGISGITGVINILIYTLVIIIVMLAFRIRFNERTKEFGVLRILGASKSKIKEIIIKEIVAFSILGGVVGGVIATIFITNIVGPIEELLEIHISIPQVQNLIGIGSIGVLVTTAIILVVTRGIVSKVYYEEAGITAKYE